MKQSKRTMRALLTSVLAMLVCLSMLVGSTFAWFTSSAETGTNTITAGTLVVDLVNEKDETLVGKTLEFVKATGGETEEVLWEPGCTYELPAVYVKNNGTLALKYKIIVTGITGSEKLLEAIEWTVTKGGVEEDLATYEGHVAPESRDDAPLVITGHMKEEANNDYQGLEASGISITVLATQDTVEHDSFDNQYDKKAGEDWTYTDDVTELTDALAEGGNIELRQDMNVDVTEENADDVGYAFNNEKDTVLDLSGKTIDFQDTSHVGYSPIMQYRSSLVIDGDGVITSNNTLVQAYYGSNITINSGTFIPQGITACVIVNCDEREPVTVTINGGTFYQCDGDRYILQTYAYDNGDSWKNANQNGGTIVVNGGTFVGISEDLAVDADPTPFVNLETHEVIKTVNENGAPVFTVVPKA